MGTLSFLIKKSTVPLWCCAAKNVARNENGQAGNSKSAFRDAIEGDNTPLLFNVVQRQKKVGSTGTKFSISSIQFFDDDLQSRIAIGLDGNDFCHHNIWKDELFRWSRRFNFFDLLSLSLREFRLTIGNEFGLCDG